MQVTFKDPEAAKKACEDASPVINGRRANCNLASLGARRSKPSSIPPQPGKSYSDIYTHEFTKFSGHNQEIYKLFHFFSSVRIHRGTKVYHIHTTRGGGGKQPVAGVLPGVDPTYALPPPAPSGCGSFLRVPASSSTIVLYSSIFKGGDGLSHDLHTKYLP